MITVLATYALLLQGVLGFAAAASHPLVQGYDGAFPICHQAPETAGSKSSVPIEHRHDHGACVLCCIMQCGVALLAGSERLQVPAGFHAAPRPVFARSDAPRREEVAAQPRGPPSLA